MSHHSRIGPAQPRPLPASRSIDEALTTLTRAIQDLAAAVQKDAFQAPPAAAGAVPVAPQASGGKAPVFTGFDAQKLASDLKLGDDGRPKSAKYTFAKLAQASGSMPGSKGEAESWFNANIKPGMEAAGFQVGWVKGDKALIATREHPQGEVIDFVRGASGSDPALAWQPVSTAGDAASFSGLPALPGTAASVAAAAASSASATDATAPADSAEASYRQLIAADIKSAYGRDATEQDYAYWLPKLEGPCDSGFVTSGQMSGTEYWHRRMLGWQAGGSDLATQGPYAGSSDARGPVPAATDVVASVPPGGLTQTSASSDAFKRLIDADLMAAYGRPATEQDYAYWLPKLEGPCDSGFVTSGQMSGTEYWHRRMLGWQAGGSDLATKGPYAGSSDARGPVPSADAVLNGR